MFHSPINIFKNVAVKFVHPAAFSDIIDHRILQNCNFAGRSCKTKAKISGAEINSSTG